jgi:hypothetical protein
MWRLGATPGYVCVACEPHRGHLTLLKDMQMLFHSFLDHSERLEIGKIVGKNPVELFWF